MQIESVHAHASELSEFGFGNAPEAIDAVNVVMTFDNTVVAMVNTDMLVISDIDKIIAAFNPVGVDDAV